MALSYGREKFNVGLYLFDKGQIASLGKDGVANEISISATSLLGTEHCHGVFLEKESIIQSVEGNLFVLGSSQGKNDFNNGVLLQDRSEIASIGRPSETIQLYIQGTGGSGSIGTVGVQVDQSSCFSSESAIIVISGGYQELKK